MGAPPMIQIRVPFGGWLDLRWWGTWGESYGVSVSIPMPPPAAHPAISSGSPPANGNTPLEEYRRIIRVSVDQNALSQKFPRIKSQYTAPLTSYTKGNDQGVWTLQPT